MVTANTRTNDVAVFTNSGDWGFRKPRYYDAGVRPDALAIVDVNGDGSPDLLVGVNDGVQILLNGGNGVFERGPAVPVIGRSGLAAGEFSVRGAIGARLGRERLTRNGYLQNGKRSSFSYGQQRHCVPLPTRGSLATAGRWG